MVSLVNPAFREERESLVTLERRVRQDLRARTEILASLVCREGRENLATMENLDSQEEKEIQVTQVSLECQVERESQETPVLREERVHPV